ncbi:hypothetical protein HOD83_01870 [Candidatus Woesearchaeota archaeon]|jgi:hypothetical protein|nr:hypothetical protein [Candidatus Woesearchaeota archaeon]MBT4114104.1 hypothetical protein [Candidatus Woesearchaeota archaeon]MBT4248313.1 hypothetical protein [Candidatus Woesearchaeota archaeon]
MGFLDSLKSILKSKTELEEKVIETIKSTDLKKWIQGRKKDIATEEAEFLARINTRINQLADELEKEVAELKEIDFDNLKIEKRTKFITGVNLDKYIDHLKNLIETLRNLDLTTSADIMVTITKVFNEFDQKAMKNFQKASFFVGHKLGDIGISTARFFKDIKQLISANETLIKNTKMIQFVGSRLDEIDNLEKTAQEFTSQKASFEKEVSKLEDEKKRVTKEIDTVKNSKTYAKETQKREDLEKDKTELTKNIYKLRTLIDFKLLANTFHSNPKQIAIVREYKANFEAAFQRDAGRKLISLLEEAKVNHGNVLDSINKITATQQKIDNTLIEPDRVNELNHAIGDITRKIEEITSKTELEQKKYDKFQANRERVLSLVREKLAEIDVVLE